MKALAKRLQALEGTQASSYDLWSDAQLIERMNEITIELRSYGCDFPLLDGGPDDAERLRATEALASKTLVDLEARHRLTH